MSVMHLENRREALEALYSPWQPRTLSQLLDCAADRYGDKILVLTDREAFSYEHIRAWSKRIAGGLVELGIQPGEHVALVMANHPEFVAIKFAIARIGAVCVPVNFLLRERELSYVLRQSNAVALITMDQFRQSNYVAMLDSMMVNWEQTGGGEGFPKLRDVVVFSDPFAVGDLNANRPASPRGWRSLSDVEAMDTLAAQQRLDALDTERNPTDNCDILYTSGTTGNPKGVLLTHDMVVRSGYASAFSRGLTPGYRIIYSLPMYHVFGYIECLLAATFAGSTVVPRLVFDPVDMLSSVGRLRIQEIACVPTMTLALIAEARTSQYDLSSITIMYSSGGAAPSTIWDDIEDVFAPDAMVHGYGQTETTAAMTSAMTIVGPDGREDHHVRHTNGRFRQAGASGDPTLGGVLAVYKIIDVETGLDLVPGETGELVVRGPAVTAGYYEKPLETQEAFDPNGWLHTGDLGVIDADGYVHLVGRLKETYRCGGEMVMPKELENLLMEHPGVSQAHVVGVPHPRMGEVGCAVIVAAAGTAKPGTAAASATVSSNSDLSNKQTTVRPSEQELIDLCARELARFKVPAHVLFMDASDLPLTVTGRVQKFRLVEMAVERLQNRSNA